MSLQKAACSDETGTGCILCLMQQLGRLEHKIQHLHSLVHNASAQHRLSVQLWVTVG